MSEGLVPNCDSMVKQVLQKLGITFPPRAEVLALRCRHDWKIMERSTWRTRAMAIESNLHAMEGIRAKEIYYQKMYDHPKTQARHTSKYYEVAGQTNASQSAMVRTTLTVT